MSDNIKVGICRCHRHYTPSSVYKTIVLKPNYCCHNDKNILTQEQLSEKNVKYVIKYNFSLGGETITVPENCILEFDGGSISNGTIIGQETVFINVSGVDIWGENLTREGTWEEKQGVTVDDSLSPNSINPVQNKVVYNALNDKQSTLVSGQNIKTINGQSILGNGDIEVETEDIYAREQAQQALDGVNATNNELTATKTRITSLESAGFITKFVTDLENYYRKSETYSQAQINGMLATVEDFEPVIGELPASGETQKIYFVPDANHESYSEYIWDANAATPGFVLLATHNGDITAFVQTIKDLQHDSATARHFTWEHYGLNNNNANLQLNIASQDWLDSGWQSANLLKGITFDNTGFGNVIVVLADKSIDTSSVTIIDGLWTSFKYSTTDLKPLIYSLPFEVGYYRIFFNKNGITEADIEAASLKVHYGSANRIEQYIYKDLYKIGCEKTPDNTVDGYIDENGNITTNTDYNTRIYHVLPGEKVWLKGSNHATGNLYCYGLYTGVPASNTFVSGITIDQALGHGKSSGGQVGSLDNFIIIPEGISYIATTSYLSDGFSATLHAYSVELNINKNFAWKHFGINTNNANLQLDIPAHSWLDSGWIKADGIESIFSNTNSNFIIAVVLASVDIDTSTSEVVNGKWLLIQKKSKYFNISRQGYGFEIGYIRILIYTADNSSISTHDADDLNIKLSYYSESNNNDVNLFSLNWQNAGFSYDSNGLNLNIPTQAWFDSGWMPICDIKAFKFNKRVKLFVILATEYADLTATSLNYDVARFQSSEGSYLELLNNNSNFKASYIRIYIYSNNDNLSNKGNALGLAEIEIIRESQKILLDNYTSGKELVPGSTQDGYLAETGEIINHSLYKCRIYNVENRNVVMISGTFESTPAIGVFAIYNGEVSTNNLVWCVVNRELADSPQYWSGGRKITVARLITIPKGTKYLVTNSVIGETQLLAYDVTYIDTIKYIDCLGDSLTMGHTRLGWFEDELQHLVGGAYKVRNWGVGGESIATIMCRQGSAAVKFPNTFTLPANGSEVEIANGSNSTYMTSMFNGARVTPLLQGSNKEYNHRINVINPCYINGIECTMTRYLIDESGSDVVVSNIRYTLKRNNPGNRDVTFSQNTSVLFNTGKEMGKADIAIIWMGTNGGYNNSFEELVEANKIAIGALTTNKYIVIGLHRLSKADGETYETLMYKEFGNRFFNIREYCCTNLCYDAGITPSSADIANMQAGICPACVLQDGVHFLPASNKAIGTYLYNMMVGLGYFK